MNSGLALPNEGQSGSRVSVDENREIYSASHVAVQVFCLNVQGNDTRNQLIGPRLVEADISLLNPELEIEGLRNSTYANIQQSADVGGSGDFAVKLQLIERFGRISFRKDGVKSIGQWSEDHVGEQDCLRKRERQMKRAEPSKCADRGGTPNRGSRIEPTEGSLSSSRPHITKAAAPAATRALVRVPPCAAAIVVRGPLSRPCQ
jgi:hypothetical protein